MSEGLPSVCSLLFCHLSHDSFALPEINKKFKTLLVFKRNTILSTVCENYAFLCVMLTSQSKSEI